MKLPVLVIVCALLGSACDRGSASSTSPTGDKPTTAAAPKATSAPTATATATAAPPPPAPGGKDRGTVTVKALLDGFKKEPGAWVGSTVHMKGAVTSYTMNTFTLDASGAHGPDKAGTWFIVYLTDPAMPRGTPSVGCLMQEGKPLADVRAAFDKKDVVEEEVVVEASGPIEASFGAMAPCTVGKIAIGKRKK
jgi:hypothetical protein